MLIIPATLFILVAFKSDPNDPYNGFEVIALLISIPIIFINIWEWQDPVGLDYYINPDKPFHSNPSRPQSTKRLLSVIVLLACIALGISIFHPSLDALFSNGSGSATLEVSSIQTAAVATFQAKPHAKPNPTKKSTEKPAFTEIAANGTAAGSQPTDTPPMETLTQEILETATETIEPSATKTKPGPTSTKAPTAVPEKVYQVGDSININGIVISLDSADITTDLIKTTLTIRNNTSTELPVDSMLEFILLTQDNTVLERDLTNLTACASTDLDGSIPAGGSVQGLLCWTGQSSPSYKLYFSPDFMFDPASSVIWKINSP